MNRVGQDGNGVLFNGHSKVFNSVGKELGSAIENKEDILQVEICSEDLNTTRKKMNFLKDRDDFILE